MTNQTIGYGLALLLLGVGGYLASGRASLTALIPAAFGVVALACGLVARNEAHRKHAIHVVLIVALLAVLGTARGTVGMVKWLLGTAPERPMAIVAQTITFVLSVGLVVLGIRSFRAARRAREAAAG